MENQLARDINEQADNLARVIDHLYGPQRAQIEAAAASLDRSKPVTLIGMGSAAYLCRPAEFYLNNHGVFSTSPYGSDAYHEMLPALKQANVVINSRSGETVEIVQLSRALSEAGLPFTAITNEPESTLARLATHVIWTDSYKDELVSINIVTSMMTATLVLAAFVLGEEDAMRRDLAALPGLMEQTVAQAWAQADQMAEFFAPVRPAYILARGASVGASYCARLVLEEVARYPAVSLEAGEFRQGPIEVVDDRFGAMIYVPSGPAGRLNVSLGRDLLGSGGRVFFVGDTQPVDHPQAMTHTIQGVADPLRPVLEVVPAQVLAYKLAERQGYAPGTVRFISKVITTEEGIPRLQV